MIASRLDDKCGKKGNSLEKDLRTFIEYLKNIMTRSDCHRYRIFPSANASKYSSLW